MTYKKFEQMVSDKLTEYNIVHEMEGELKAFGHKHGKGKHDIKLENCNLIAMELKTVKTLARLNYPRPGIKQPLIKVHQLKALRSYKDNKRVGFLINDEETGKMYFFTVAQFDQMIVDNGLFKSFKGYLDGYVIELDEFVKGLKEKRND